MMTCYMSKHVAKIKIYSLTIGLSTLDYVIIIFLYIIFNVKFPVLPYLPSCLLFP